MKSDPSKSIVEQLSDIRNDAAGYFQAAIDALSTEEYKKTTSYRSADEFWPILPENLRKQSDSISSRLAGLAQITGPAILRSPLLTEADAREAGHAFKRLRSALRFREFLHVDAHVLHDEDLVLGVRPSSDYENAVGPDEAGSIFDASIEGLKQRLELADPDAALAPDVSLTPPKQITTAIRPGTAFIMMWITEDKPDLVDVSNTVKECFANLASTRFVQTILNMKTPLRNGPRMRLEQLNFCLLISREKGLVYTTRSYTRTH